MKPLTHEELNRIEKVGMVTQFMPFSDEKMEWRTIEKKALDALIAAARRSTPRPIAEAPRDGTKVVVKDPIYGWCEGMSFGDVWENEDGWKLLPTEFIPIPEQTDGTV